jgi:ABC-type uncharacterized transport system permease subunit
MLKYKYLSGTETMTTLVISHLKRPALKAFLTTALKFIFGTILQRTKTGLHGRACDSAPQTLKYRFR